MYPLALFLVNWARGLYVGLRVHVFTLSTRCCAQQVDSWYGMCLAEEFAFLDCISARYV